MLLTMLDDVPAAESVDWCQGVHGEWQLNLVGESRHGRNILEWVCGGCPHTERTETYRDSHERLQYPDPDGVLIEFEEPRRRHRR